MDLLTATLLTFLFLAWFLLAAYAFSLRNKENAKVALRELNKDREMLYETAEEISPKREIPLSQARPASLAQEETWYIPNRYGENKIVLLVRDPYWAFCYWEITDSTREDLERRYGEAYRQAREALRVYDITSSSYEYHFDIPLAWGADNWYIHLGRPGGTFYVEIGRITKDGWFISMARSNVITTPRAAISDVTYEEWLPVEDEYMTAYRRQTEKKMGISSPGIGEAISSPGISPWQK